MCYFKLSLIISAADVMPVAAEITDKKCSEYQSYYNSFEIFNMLATIKWKMRMFWNFCLLRNTGVSFMPPQLLEHKWCKRVF